MNEFENERTAEELREEQDARDLNGQLAEGDDRPIGEPQGSRPWGGEGEADDAGEEEREERPRPQLAPDPRDAIAARQDAEFERSTARGLDTSPSDDEIRYGSFAHEGEEGAQPSPGDEAPSSGDGPPPEQRQLAADDMLVEMTIRGERKLVTVAEARAEAQRNLAGDTYLADARAILEEAKAHREAIQRGAKPETPEQRREAEKGLSPEQVEQRRKMFETITYGTPEEVEQAFERFQFETEERAVRRMEARQEQAARRDHFVGRIEGAKNYLAEQMPDLGQHEGYVDVYAKTLAEGQKEILAKFVENLPPAKRAQLARHNVTPDLLRGLTNPTTIMETYADFDIKGYTVPPVDRVMLAAGVLARRRLGLPDLPAQPGRGTTPADDHGRGPVRLSSDRMARKEQLSPQTPRASAGPGQSSQSRREVTEQEAHRAAMAERQQVGFTLPRRR